MSDISETMRIIDAEERKTLAQLAQKNKRWFEIQETIYLGKMKNGKDLYRLAELDNKDNYTAILYKYFDENAQVKGIKNVRPDGLEQWVYLDEEWEELRDEIDRNEAQIVEQIEETYGKLGISKEDIKNITEVDLKQKIREIEEEQLEEDKELEEQQDDEKEEEKPQHTSKYTNVLNEVETDKFIDQKGTELGEALGLDQYGYTKLLIVHADNVRDIRDADGNYHETPTKKLAILGVREIEGKQVVEPIPEDILDYDRRSNNHSVRFDDDAVVEKNTGTFERFVNPRTNRGITIELSEMEAKVYYQGGIDLDDNTPVMGRVEDGRTGWIEAETKEIFNYNHGEYQQDKVNAEMDMHVEDKGKEISRENADGDLNTVSGHIHQIDENSEIIYNGKLMTVEEVAQLPEFKVSTKYFVELYNAKAKELEGKEDINVDEIYEGIENDVNEQMQGPQNR